MFLFLECDLTSFQLHLTELDCKCYHYFCDRTLEIWCVPGFDILSSSVTYFVAQGEHSAELEIHPNDKAHGSSMGCCSTLKLVILSFFNIFLSQILLCSGQLLYTVYKMRRAMVMSVVSHIFKLVAFLM